MGLGSGIRNPGSGKNGDSSYLVEPILILDVVAEAEGHAAVPVLVIPPHSTGIQKQVRHFDIKLYLTLAHPIL